MTAEIPEPEVSEQDAFDRLVAALGDTGYVTDADQDMQLISAGIYTDLQDAEPVLLGSVLIQMAHWGPRRRAWMIWMPPLHPGQEPRSGWWMPIGPIEYDPQGAVEVADSVISLLPGVNRRPRVRWWPRPGLGAEPVDGE
ncbi:hypothetical protein [Marinitenerispora sediminis]|uniref:Uncharacterized protein n=1 Tax=Marinitenerispora sediminis TaxID=1931232 RepID=A0A368SYP9_9ACTN|nr:hypothetical protein [Marinitenerispora sediminis]RCV47705.1 hypothetical protein DEF28_25515 [Marinitenerispora sediminis]RCV49486.1 hypothetical protein DEF24_25215 [Marinitenerispora sediminis]RCV49679.1 hypothetical protein DEF23_23280 [Marinitenerispora sediminis]